MKATITRSVLTVCATLAVALLPFGSGLDAQGKGTIKIATQSPLSGGQAALGEGIKLGTQLAVEKYKGPLEKMGFKVEVVPFDDQAKPDVGVANARMQGAFLLTNQLLAPPIGAFLFVVGMALPFIGQSILVAAGAVLISRISLVRRGRDHEARRAIRLVSGFREQYRRVTALARAGR